MDTGHGRAALHYRNGRPVGARWRLESRATLGPRAERARKRKDFRCADADLWGIDDWVFDVVEIGDLEVTTGVRARTKGIEVQTKSSVREMQRLWERWRREAERWSAKPGAGAALAAHVKDFRLTWVGVYVSRGPTAEIGEDREQAGDY